jgi:FkbM family methyltransferase
MTPPPFVTEHNELWLLSEDRSIRPAIQKCNQLNWDQVFLPVLERLDKRAKRRGIVVDAGAFIGDSTEWFAGNYQCITFEPQIDAFTCLIHNLPLETHFPYPVGNGETVDLKTETDGPGNLGSRAVIKGSTIKTMRLDDLGLDELALLKVDVEGSEPLVLDGAKDTIARCKPMVLVEINIPALSKRGLGAGHITDRFQGWQATEIYRFNQNQYDLLFIPRI